MGLPLQKQTEGEEVGWTLHWPVHELRFEVVPAARGAFDTVQFLRIAEQSAKVWNERTAASAPKIYLQLGPSEGVADEDPVQDGINQIVIRTRPFCAEQRRTGLEDCYDRRRQATTHLYPDLRRQHLDEADIELNGVDPLWITPTGAIDSMRLGALLVHEWGHVLGLDHSCGLLNSRGGQAADALASCEDSAALASVMYPDPLSTERPLILVPTRDALSELQRRYASDAPSKLGAALCTFLLLTGALLLAVRWATRHGKLARTA